MTSVLLIIHIVLALSIIGLVLLQRGTGGGLGLGESGGMGGFASPRSAANILTKATTWCAILFFGTSLGLAITASRGGQSSVVDQLTSGAPATEQSAPAAAPEVPAQPGAIDTDEASPADPAPEANEDIKPAAPEAPVTP